MSAYCYEHYQPTLPHKFRPYLLLQELMPVIIKSLSFDLQRLHWPSYTAQHAGILFHPQQERETVLHRQQTHLHDNISHKSTHSASSCSSRHPLPPLCWPASTRLPLSLPGLPHPFPFFFYIPLFLPPSCETVSSVCSLHKPQHDTVTPAITSPADFYWQSQQVRPLPHVCVCVHVKCAHE